MMMTTEQIYDIYDNMANGILKVTPIDHFIFDLTDDNSLKSLKSSFPGIEVALMPESGKYLVASPIVEKQDCLVLMFPQMSDGSMGMYAYDKPHGTTCNLMQQVLDGDGKRPTIENFMDFANRGEIENRFNEFAFGNPGDNSSSIEVKDIGSFEVSNDEPVEINNTTTDNEETEMKFKPINEEDELKDTKWVEIPNTNAHGVTVTEDGEEAEDPFADMSADAGGGDAAPQGDAAPAQDAAQGDANAEQGDAAQAPVEGDAAAPAEGEAAPAEGDATPAEGEAAPAEGGDAPAETIDDPKAKMRELLAYYTNYMTELVQDPNTSTDLISATQEMIDSLIKNMESADGIEEVKAETEEAAKTDVSAEQAPAEGEGGEAAPAEGGEQVQETTEEQAALDAKIDNEVDALHSNDWEDIQPATSDDVLTPGDLRNSAVNDVDLSGAAPTPDEELAATAPDETFQPTSDVLDDTELPSPDEEVKLFGPEDDAMVGPDGLPLDKFEGDVADLDTVPTAKKVSWSSDYALNGVATSDDTCVVVPEVLKELEDYYKKVSDEVSKVPGKEDVAMKLQKIQILSQTIANEWNSVCGDIGCACANSFDRSNMGDLEKDELDSQDALGQVGADVMADQEQDEEDDLKVNADIAAFCESFKHLI